MILGGRTTAQVSNAFETLITPAGYVFSIWGVIYILLGVFVVTQALPSQKESKYQRRVGWLFVLSSALNIAWLFLWQSEYLAFSVVIIFLLLGTLIAIYLRLNIGKPEVSLRERLTVHLPFSVYLGWITIASIANVAAALISANWNGFGIGSETWATTIIIVALAITLLVVATRGDIAYGLVIIWAYLGIAANQMRYPTIVTVTEVGAGVVAVALVPSAMVRLRRGRSHGESTRLLMSSGH